MPDQPQPICQMLLLYNSFVRHFHAIWGVERSWAITQKLKFCQAWNLGWKVKNHTHSPSRELLGKSSVKVEKKNKKSPILRPCWPIYLSKSDFCAELCYVSSLMKKCHFTKKTEKALVLRKMLNWSKGEVRDSQIMIS